MLLHSFCRDQQIPATASVAPMRWRPNFHFEPEKAEEVEELLSKVREALVLLRESESPTLSERGQRGHREVQQQLPPPSSVA